MKTSNTLFILVLFLLLLNTGLLIAHFLSTPDKNTDNKDFDKSWVAEELGLSTEQESQHVKMRNAYFEELGVLNDSIRTIRSRFMAQTAYSELTDSMSRMWTDSINHWHRRADELAFRHTRNVRAILNEKQKPLWDSIVQVILRRQRKD